MVLLLQMWLMRNKFTTLSSLSWLCFDCMIYLSTSIFSSLPDTLKNLTVTFKCWQKSEIPGNLLQLFMERGSVGALSKKHKQCQMKRACVMRLQCSPERPCRPAFVCNYCLIKHAGQLPASGPLATDTQLYTECLLPPKPGPLPLRAASIFEGNSHKNLSSSSGRVAPPAHGLGTECQLPAAAVGQVRSLSSHKDNTIILKRLWSPVIEFSKGSRTLWGRGGQLMGGEGARESGD